jgi:hypothetical protein
MEPRKKNKPAPIVIFGIVAMVVAIISYLSVVVFFPELFQSLPTGDAQPVKAN